MSAHLDTDITNSRLRTDPDRLLTYGEFSKWIGVPESTVRKWVAAGTGPRVLRLGRHVRIRVTDVLAWLDEQGVAA